ncbi:MAG: hypothetical protein IPN38_02345 [Flavobacteriales bacterium]|nr:hypothetical protein [Flavobacteriales bacterium]
MEVSVTQPSTSVEADDQSMAIILFYGIAIAISNLFRFDLFEPERPPGAWSGISYVIIRNVLEGSGVFIGALVGIYLLRQSTAGRDRSGAHRGDPFC